MLRSMFEYQMAIYLGGGAHPEDVTSCVRVSNCNIFLERLQKCDRKEADDRSLLTIVLTFLYLPKLS